MGMRDGRLVIELNCVWWCGWLGFVVFWGGVWMDGDCSGDGVDDYG